MRRMGSRENEPIVWLLDVCMAVVVACVFALMLGRWVVSWFLP